MEKIFDFKDGSVLLIYLTQEGSSYGVSGKVEYRLVNRPKLGLLYLSAVLNQQGIENNILDQTTQPFLLEDLISILKRYRILFLGFYTADALESKVCNYIREIKKNTEVPIIVGGPGSLNPAPYINAETNIVCIGEGEKTILEIVDFLHEKRKINEVNGIAYSKNGGVVRSSPQDLIKDLDALPFPNRDKISIHHFRDFNIYNMKLPYTTMITSRGCLYRCSFCTSHNIWMGKIRSRSPLNVIEEIDELVRKYGVKFISFQDDIFGFNDDWLREFSGLLVGRKYNLNWMCILHPLSFRKKRNEMLDLLRAAGCNTISLGVQSADKNLLEGIRRRESELNSAIDLVKASKKRGMLTAISFILGLPGETKETINKTIDFAVKCKPHHAEFYSFAVLKGSEIDTKYKNKTITSLRKKEVSDFARYAMRKFYSNPMIIWQNIYYILRYSPIWPFKIF